MSEKKRVPDPTLMARLQLSVKGVDWAAGLVAPWQHESFDGEWTAHQHLFHLLNAERLHRGRIAQALAEEHPTFVRFESDAHMRDAYTKDEDINVLAERFVAERAGTYETFKALMPEQWNRTFTWPDGTVHDLAWFAEKVLWHALDHFGTLLDLHGEFEPRQGTAAG